MYERISAKYRWGTLTWALVDNHHHFVVRLTCGGLSEGMRELHGGFSRWIHQIYGLTRQGHLFRHAFFARELRDDREILVACSYVDLNIARAHQGTPPEKSTWCGYRANIGLEHPRRFHSPSALLEIVDRRPAAARAAYAEYVQNGLGSPGPGPSPNEDWDEWARAWLNRTA